MIDYNNFHEIKRLESIEKLNARQIASKLGLSKKTVRKYLSKDKFEIKKRTDISSKLDSFKESINSYVHSPNGYTGQQILQMVREEGYEGGKSILYEEIARIRPPRHTAYLTLSFSPGEAAQVDFASCRTILVGETNRRLSAFVMTLCYSRVIYVEFIMRENMEHFLQCHRNAFEYFGGVPEKVMVDNCKVAVSKASQFGNPVLNSHYSDLASHYGFKIIPCGIRKPNEKGIVERGIGYLKQNFLNGREISTLTALNRDVKDWMENTANVRLHGTTRKKPIELFKEERKHFIPLGLFPYDCAVIRLLRVSKQFHVTFETNKYSVPAEFACQKINVKIYPDKLIFCKDDKILCEHKRSYERHKVFTELEHEKKLLAERKRAKKGRIMKRFLDMGSVAEKYYKGLCNKRLKPDKHIRKIVVLSEMHGTEAIKKAMSEGIEFEAFNSDYIENIIEIRNKPLPEEQPLHLIRKSDLMEIELNEPNLNIY